jgi:uncharacterized protein YegL
MSTDLVLRREDLVHNPTPRLPICLVLDCSPSMSGETRYGSSVEQTNPRPIDELNSGIELFFNSIKEDEIAQFSAEICLVAFSGVAEKVLDFDNIARIEPPVLQLEMSKGGTSIGTAVNLAIELLEERKSEYQEVGVDFYEPWLVLMTDGHPTDDSHNDSSINVSKLVLESRLQVFPIGIGHGVDMDVLKLFSPKRDPLRLKGLRFREFFEWLSKSVSNTSQSIPGEEIPLDIEGIKGWGAL